MTTNYERIKQMTVDEMAYWVDENFEIGCEFCGYYCKGDCVKGFKQWLLKEAENEEHNELQR
jgi:hypothetical protein